MEVVKAFQPFTVSVVLLVHLASARAVWQAPELFILKLLVIRFTPRPDNPTYYDGKPDRV